MSFSFCIVRLARLRFTECMANRLLDREVLNPFGSHSRETVGCLPCRPPYHLNFPVMLRRTCRDLRQLSTEKTAISTTKVTLVILLAVIMKWFHVTTDVPPDRCSRDAADCRITRNPEMLTSCVERGGRYRPRFLRWKMAVMKVLKTTCWRKRRNGDVRGPGEALQMRSMAHFRRRSRQ